MPAALCETAVSRIREGTNSQLKRSCLACRVEGFALCDDTVTVHTHH
jgi:hypothetical protein